MSDQLSKREIVHYSILLICLAIIVYLLSGCSAVKTVRVCSQEGCGAGYVDKNGMITTALHNVASGKDVSVSEGWYRRPAKILKISIAQDVAHLNSGGVYNWSNVSYCPAYIGDDVTIYARVSQSIEREYRGSVALAADGYYLIDGYVADFGHSGSPVVRDRDQCVIGIVVSRYDMYKVTKVSKVK